MRVDGSGSDATVKLIDRSYVKALSAHVRTILVEQKDGKMDAEEFKKALSQA